MGLIALTTVEIMGTLESPEFTEQGLILPLEYFAVYETYYHQVINELEVLNFDELVKQAILNNIQPTGGFAEWIGEATLITWMLALKRGHTDRAFYPKTVALSIVQVSQSMFADKLLSKFKGTIN